MAPAIDRKQESHLEAGLVDTMGEKTAGAVSKYPGPERLATHSRRMAPLRRVILAITVCLVVAFSLATVTSLRLPHTCSGKDRDTYRGASTVDDNSRLSRLWQSASPDVLRELLDKYFPERTSSEQTEQPEKAEAVEMNDKAVEEIQTDLSDVAPVYPTLAQLVRRAGDAGNGTVTTKHDTTTEKTTVPPTSTTSLDSTTTKAPDTTTTTPDSPTSGTSTLEETSSTTSSSSSKASVSGSTSTTSTTSAPPVTTSITSAKKTTFPHFSTTITESTARHLTSSAVRHIITSTLDNGGVTTVTSTSWVAIAPPAEATQKQPKLQNDAPSSRGMAAIPVIMGIFVGAILMV